MFLLPYAVASLTTLIILIAEKSCFTAKLGITCKFLIGILELKHLLNVFGVGVSCRNLYSFVVYLYVSGSGSITSVGKERANLSAVVYL